MTKVITLNLALELLDRAVQEKGADYEYPNAETGECVYAFNDAPSCIVGHALSYVGLTAEQLYKLDNTDFVDAAISKRYPDENRGDVSTAVQDIVVALEDEFGVSLDTGALAAFKVAQRQQDNGITWGDAVASAKDPFNRQRAL